MSLAILLSRSLSGLDAPLVRVETHLGAGLPAFHVVGLADAEVRESRERVRAAILSSGLKFPSGRLTVNLSPADLPKESGRFDLPIALGVLLVSGQVQVVDPEALPTLVLAGELSLTGALVPTRGAVALGLAVARTQPNAVLILPLANAKEVACIPDLRVLGASSLNDVVSHLNGYSVLTPISHKEGFEPSKQQPCLSDVRGQMLARRAIEVAAAGGHSLLLSGSPGVGKSMLAKRLPGLLPPLSNQESLEIAALFNYAGIDAGISRERPIRSPHHTASVAAVIGGGIRPIPGEISLSHHGVLFLDELPEFDRRVREALREPLENGVVNITRARGKCQFPARFQLVATMNPCPCGWRGHATRACRCSEPQVQRYQMRVSGPLLDRIDLKVNMGHDSKSLIRSDCVETSSEVALRVHMARDIQTGRQLSLNAHLSDAMIERNCPMDDGAKILLVSLMEKHGLSARTVQRATRVARTCADLAGSEVISRVHLSESYRYLAVEPMQ